VYRESVVVTGNLPEFQVPRDVDCCLVAKSVLLQRAHQMDLPPNFLDEISQHSLPSFSISLPPGNGDRFVASSLQSHAKTLHLSISFQISRPDDIKFDGFLKKP
jgi:hypothetical protein